jgi:hypothetical protein
MVNTFFGEPWDAPFIDDAVQVATPVGESCVDCHDPIADGDQGVVMPCISEGPGGAPVADLRPTHRECFIRAVIGPVEHFVEGRCSGGPHSEENWREQGRATIAWLEAHR